MPRKILQEKSPAKSSKTHTTKIPDTFLQRGRVDNRAGEGEICGVIFVPLSLYFLGFLTLITIRCKKIANLGANSGLVVCFVCRYFDCFGSWIGAKKPEIAKHRVWKPETQARKKSTKINFLGPETARWGGGLPLEGVVAENFVPALESLSSLGFEERNLGCPRNFAGMSRTPGGVQKVCAKKLRVHFSFPILLAGFS